MWWRKRQQVDAASSEAGADEAGGASSSTGPSQEAASEPARKRARGGPSPEEEKELHGVQLQLQLLEEGCAKEQIAIQQRYDRKRQPHFERRSKMLRKIPVFWRNALCGHPLRLTHPAETEALAFLQDLDVRDNLDESGSYEVRATFSENSLFKEKSIVKKVTFQESCMEVVEAATLSASGDEGRKLMQELEKATAASATGGNDGPAVPRSVLGWFISSRKSSPQVLDDFADVLRRDLWQDPVPYYMSYRDMLLKQEAAAAAGGPKTSAAATTSA